MTQLRITQSNFNHIKFDSSNQETFLRSNRNKLPSIQHKGNSSMDHRYQNYEKSKDKK